MGNILKKTKDNIYYIETYVPSRNFQYYSEKEVAFSKEIWAYKDGKEEALVSMTEKYIEAIRELVIQNEIHTHIALVAAPTSKVEKYAPVAESIKRVYRYYMAHKREKEAVFGGYKLLDFKLLLKRTIDVPASHAEKRVRYEEHKSSISCRYGQLSKYQTSYIILDDVVTTGTLLKVCEDILIEHGAEAQSIYKLVLATTV